jgi:hypothetical protein
LFEGPKLASGGNRPGAFIRLQPDNLKGYHIVILLANHVEKGG